jgi:hypothetical protein
MILVSVNASTDGTAKTAVKNQSWRITLSDSPSAGTAVFLWRLFQWAGVTLAATTVRPIQAVSRK